MLLLLLWVKFTGGHSWGIREHPDPVVCGLTEHGRDTTLHSLYCTSRPCRDPGCYNELHHLLKVLQSFFNIWPSLINTYLTFGGPRCAVAPGSPCQGAGAHHGGAEQNHKKKKSLFLGRLLYLCNLHHRMHRRERAGNGDN